jgi:hypothetical protein
MGIIEKKKREYMITQNEDKRIEIQKAYLYFLEQIIACHAGHTVICNDKIHFHFLQKHKKTEKKKSETQKRWKIIKKGEESLALRKEKQENTEKKERKKEILPDDR